VPNGTHGYTRIKTRRNMDKPNLIYRELTSQIISSAFEVGNILGCGFLEKVYENALKVELIKRGLKVESQRKVEVLYKDTVVGVYQIDLLVERKIILEIKTIDKISDIQRAQLMNYLRSTNLKVGFIFNFAKTKVEYERIIL
jgi:GxxExxY protein